MRLVATLIDLYSLVVLAAVVMSWVRMDRRHPLRGSCTGSPSPSWRPSAGHSHSLEGSTSRPWCC